mmetsp:Transcript_18292/g.44173  ORF Transcript_18292/g.44173 Transcript_18292/m.44173 type:complete len:271 (+) Transcript_18292:109-921(+)
MVDGQDAAEDRDFGYLDSTSTSSSDLIREARRNAINAIKIRRCGDDDDGTDVDGHATTSLPRPRPHTQTNDPILVANQHKNRGNKKFQTKDWVGAYEDYSLAIESNPRGDAAFYSNRSACLIQLNRPQQALDDAVCARMLRPTWSKACYRMAVAIIAIADDDDDDDDTDSSGEFDDKLDESPHGQNDGEEEEHDNDREEEDLYETAAMVIWDGLLLEPKNADLKILLRRCAKSGRRRYVHHQKQQQQEQQQRSRRKRPGSSSSNPPKDCS